MKPMPDTPPSSGAVIAALAVVALVVVLIIRWIRRAVPRPDPWGEEIERAVQEEDAVPLCPHCLAPQESDTWFCPACGSSIGPYNNVNPYLYAFSLGDLFRNGTTGWAAARPLVILGFLLLSFWACLAYALPSLQAIISDPVLVIYWGPGLLVLAYWGLFWRLFFHHQRDEPPERGQPAPPASAPPPA